MDAFVKKTKLYIEPITFEEVIAGIEAFVVPVLPASAAENLPTLLGGLGGLGNVISRMEIRGVHSCASGSCR
jgi:hypothetical protein